MEIPTNGLDVERIKKRQKMKLMWQLSTMYAKPLIYLVLRIKEIHNSIHRITLETDMMQRFIGDCQLDTPVENCRPSPDSSTSEMSQPTSMDSPITTLALLMLSTHGKRLKRPNLSFEHKLNIAQHYMEWLLYHIELKTRLNNTYINELIALNENMDLTARTVQNEIKYWQSKVGPVVCIAKKPGTVRERQMPSEKFWTMTNVNDIQRDRHIRGTKLDKVILSQQIQKQEEIHKYEEKVDKADFYQKLLKNRAFPNEINKLANKRLRLLFRMNVTECWVYNLRHQLEKRVIHGDKLRGRIARAKYVMDRIEHSLARAVATRDKDQHTREKLQKLLSDCAAPEFAEFIELGEQNEELKRMINVFDKKVALTKLIRDTNVQKLKRLTWQGGLSV